MNAPEARRTALHNRSSSVNKKLKDIFSIIERSAIVGHLSVDVPIKDVDIIEHLKIRLADLGYIVTEKVAGHHILCRYLSISWHG